MNLFRRLQINRLSRQFLLTGFLASLFSWLVMTNAKWLFLGLPIVSIVSFYLIKSNISTRKQSLLFLKTLRPVVIATGLLMFLTSGTGTLVYPTIINLLIAVAIGVVLVLSLRYELRTEPSHKIESVLSLSAIFLITNAVAQLQAVWGVPGWLALVASWVLYYVITNFWLSTLMDKPESLSLLWALVATEINIILSSWILFYSIPRLGLLIAQSSLIVTVLAYSMGGIYYHNRKHSLSRGLIFEYLAVTLVVFGVLLLFTKWLNAV